jgi:hypothetical protein
MTCGVVQGVQLAAADKGDGLGPSRLHRRASPLKEKILTSDGDSVAGADVPSVTGTPDANHRFALGDVAQQLSGPPTGCHDNGPP